MADDPTRELCRLFVYGTMMTGQADHGLLAGAERVGDAHTVTAFELFEVGTYAVAVAGGQTSVQGELYLVTRAHLARLDVARQVPLLFERALVALAEGEPAHAYVMGADRVRGKRRLAHGDFRLRFGSNVPRAEPGAFVKWARKTR